VLRYIDLENNKLCENDSSGMSELARSVKNNIKLLGLNLSRNELSDDVAEDLIESLNYNFYIIDLDVTFNYSITNEHILDIMDRINRNRKKYGIDRLSEWKERKLIKAELDGMVQLMKDEEKKKKDEIDETT